MQSQIEEVNLKPVLLERLRFSDKPILKLNSVQLSAKEAFVEKIQSKEYTWEEIVECPVCASEEFQLIGEKDRYGLHYPVVICKTCGVVFANPRLNEASFNSFYRDDYRPLYVGEEKPKERFFQSQIYKGQKIYRYLKSKNIIDDTPKFILEVGCGAGGILKYFEQQGHEVMGIDLGEEYINYGKNIHNLNLHFCSLTSVNLPKKPDLVIYSHVMEHLLNPKEDLQLLKQLIHLDSVIYIEVPGLKNLEKNYRMDLLQYFQNAHTFHFSLGSLKNLLNLSGYKILMGNEHVKCICVPDSDIKEELINDYENTIDYLLKLESKRLKYPFLFRSFLTSIQMIMLKILDVLKLRSIVKRIFGRYPE